MQAVVARRHLAARHPQWVERAALVFPPLGAATLPGLTVHSPSSATHLGLGCSVAEARRIYGHTPPLHYRCILRLHTQAKYQTIDNAPRALLTDTFMELPRSYYDIFRNRRTQKNGRRPHIARPPRACAGPLPRPAYLDTHSICHYNHLLMPRNRREEPAPNEARTCTTSITHW